MSILTRPAFAGAAARLLQTATKAGAKPMVSKATGRLPEFVGRTEQIEIPTSFGPAPATIYRPEAGEGNPPVHVNFHGGGYVLAVTITDDGICRALAAQTGSVVINVDYLVAPQHPFPVPPQQAYEVVKWVAENGADHDWDGGRLTIGGQSAGGALAAAAARLAFEEKTPEIALQVLHYPPLDLTVPAGTKKSTIDKPMLRPWMGDVFDTSYAADPVTRADRLISPASPADTVDLTGIAPAVVISAEQDILNAEQRRYSDRLEKAGALVAFHEVAGVDHGYDLDHDDKGRESYALIAGYIKAAIAD